ncbi:peroxiredoxin family protein [Actinoplanes couchii]|uniref:Thioredoxin domain-containing protein n=1 Tax=Actinoplanes couchii TaxID=403638 RepID=A0ABQ3XE44_9ACTN|nr:redoxin domain-containing protein [Actinoplanes couchii]MDR6317283.1 thiol-disulfide isomerase/thioredoxin [Actinoplanes couchii]GID56777.1 hypothetical protein Aco03nite_051810 [Actinoplanes couchii]
MIGQVTAVRAPEWEVASWFNSGPLTVHGLRGRVVVLEAFQMLCPGCYTHSLPQAVRLHDLFRGEPVSVIGLHSVFENHAAMTPKDLLPFLRRSRIDFPVAVDAHRWDGEIDSPVTFDRYRMMGTPTTILIDRTGTIRFHEFGRFDDSALTTRIRDLLAE